MNQAAAPLILFHDMCQCPYDGGFHKLNTDYTRIFFLSSVDSTNTDLARRIQAESECDVRTQWIVVSESQTAGRGTQGRAWESRVGGLFVSYGFFVEKTKAFPAEALTVSLARVVRRTVDQVTGVRLELKWPNDLFYEDKKMAGLLVESLSPSQSRFHKFIIIGLGLNVNQAIFSPGLSATSLFQITGRRWPLEKFIFQLQKEFYHVCTGN